MLVHLKKSIKQAHIENGTFEHIVSPLERESELNGLEAPNEVQINTMTQKITKLNPETPKPTSHHCKKPGHYRNQCRQIKKKRNRNDTNKSRAGNNNSKKSNSGQTNSNTHHKKTVSKGNANSANKRRHRKLRTLYPTSETCGKTNYSRGKCCFGANAANRPPPRNRTPMEQSQSQQQDTQVNTLGSAQAAAQVLNWRRHVFTPEVHVTDRDRHINRIATESWGCLAATPGNTCQPPQTR